MSCLMFVVALLWCAGGALVTTAFAHPGADPQPRAQQQPARQTAPHLMIQRRGDLLTVRIFDAPWDMVVQAVEYHTGVTISVAGPLVGTLTQEFDALPLDEGLRQLFREANLLLLYRQETTAGIAAVTLRRVWLLPKMASTLAVIPGEVGAPPAEEPVAEENHQARLEALHTFARQGNTEALRQALFNPDETSQAMAFDLLAEQDRPGAISALLDVIQSEQPEIRRQTLQLLHGSAQVDDQIVLSALSRALADEDTNVKRYAIQALADRGGPDALGYLRQALRDPDTSIRRVVIESVAQMDQGLTLVQEALTDDNEAVRALAAARLKRAAADER